MIDWLWLAAIVLFGLIAMPAQGGDKSLEAVGKGIYLYGHLASGMPLTARRADDMTVQGADAACANCHQRSGLGSREGNKSVPPITARYLFHPRAASRLDLDLPYVENIRADREPYTEATLARAIRDGLDTSGKPLDYLMPHYALNDTEMAAVIAYLKKLDRRQIPGVTDTVLHFATIITPDTDPAKRKAMLDVMDQFFADRNAFLRGPTPRLLSTHIEKFKVYRRWQLHVWQLNGEPATWQRQLEQDFAREPVLAAISGLGGKTWAPVHDFCEKAGLPCLFPNVEVPPAAADHDFYSLYFSKGVLLEAGLIGHGIVDPDDGLRSRVVDQIYRDGDNGEAGAAALAAELAPMGIAVRNHVLPPDASDRAISAAVRQSSRADTLVLWLRPADLVVLGDVHNAPEHVFISGLLGGLDNAPLPEGWRARTWMAYPVGLPEERLVNLDFAHGWFRIRHIAVVDFRLQADTYLACGLLSETINHMVDTFVPDYLIERMQDMLGHRVITGYYPHLSLATGQRFASKGGYLVRMEGPQGTHLVADHGWLIP